MNKKQKLKPAKKTKKKYRNNIFAFSFIISAITVGLVEIIYLLFFEAAGFGIESLHLIYIVPIMIILLPILIKLLFKHDFDCFAQIEESIRKVADGDFTVRIEDSKGGAFEETFNNFNKMVEELEKNKVLKDDFAHNFSHEFKTPIASIKGFADLILEEDLSVEEQKKYLQIISTEAERLTHLSQNALFAGKLNTEAILKDKTIFDLCEQIKDCVVLLDRQICEKSIEIVADIKSVKLYSSKELLQEVWLNIIGNAIKFSNECGTIEISVKITDNFAQVTVKDNGIGMEKDVLNKIFNAYYQVDTSHKQSGFGLGLSIVNRIVTLCGGKIDVKSTVNVGSTFTVSLPLNFVSNL